MDRPAERRGVLARRLLDDGRELVLYPMLFGNTRLCVGDPESGTYDEGWCYHDTRAALVAAATWHGRGEPPGAYKRAGEDPPSYRTQPPPYGDHSTKPSSA